MKDLKNYTKDELLEEIERRDRRRKDRPIQVKDPDFGPAVKYAEELMNDIEKGEVNDDAQHYVYETVMEAVYGKDVWNWINENSHAGDLY